MAASLIGGAHIKGGSCPPPIFGSMKTSGILTKTQSRSAPVVLDGVLVDLQALPDTSDGVLASLYFQIQNTRQG